MGFGAFPPSARERVVVTGMGLITPLGVGVHQTWRHLCAGHTAIRSLREVPYFFPAALREDRDRKQASSSSLSSSSSSSSSSARINGGATDTLTAQEELILKALPCQVAAPVCCPLHHTRTTTPCCTSSSDASDIFRPTARETRALLFARHAVREALIDAGLLRPSCTSSSAPRGATNDATVNSKHSDKKPPLQEPHNTTNDASCTPTAFTMTLHAGPGGYDRIGVNIGIGIPSLTDVSEVACHLYGNAGRVDYRRVHPFFVPKILGNMAAGAVAMEYGLTGPIGSGVAACATGAHCIGEAAHWIRSGRADVVLCGATEACITPVSVAGFARMRALSTRYNAHPAQASRPFDEARDGFVMGEGAGVLVLESLSHARARGAAVCGDAEGAVGVYGELRGFGAASDAYDVAAPHPDGRGARHCVAEALRDGGDVPSNAVGYVNAHATGTMGDGIELAALARTLRPTWGQQGECGVWAEEKNAKNDEVRSSSSSSSNSSGCSGGGAVGDTASHLCISSSKGAMGHLLGAAGSVEAAIALLALRHQIAPPTANLVNPCWSEEMQRKHGVHLVGASASEPLSDCEAVMSTSFGFGGINTALLFTKL